MIQIIKTNKNNKKNINLISYFIIFTMVLSIVFSAPVFAIETQDNVFQISNGEIIKYTGKGADLIIPQTIEGQTVTAIGKSVFSKKHITSVEIPDTVETIGQQAFFGNDLKKMKLPENLKNMGGGAFSKNQLVSITIPKILKKIPDAAFSNNQLTSVTIAEGVESIGIGAFTANQLESVIIPDSVKFIDKMAFKQNKLKNLQISKEIKTIGISVFDTNQLQSVIIPEGVTKIDDAAFRKNQLKSVTIPVSVTSIGKNVFDESVDLTYSKLVEAIKDGQNIKTNEESEEKVQALKKAIETGRELNKKTKASLQEIDAVVENIRKVIKALEKELSIKEIKSLESIEVGFGTREADVKTKLPEKISIVDSENIEHSVNITWSTLEYDGNISGEYTGVGTFELPSGIVQSNPQMDLKAKIKIIVKSKIEDNKGWNTNDFIYSGTVINGFSESGKEKFKTNKNLILPKLSEVGQTITEIGDKAFLGDYKTKQDPENGINSVKIPNTVTTIGAEAFRYNCLTSIDIPESVTTIKQSAFNGNKLKSLVIPNSVTSLEEGAFTLNEIASLKIPDGLTTIPRAFGFNKLTTITIPEGVTKIDMLAFSDNKLTEIKLPSTLKYLSGFNNNAFKAIEIPKNITELGEKAFASNKLTSVTIPGNVKVIGSRAFWNTWHDQFLTSVTIEEGVENIGPYAFASNHLKDVNIPSSLKEISKESFDTNLGYDGVVHLFTPNYENSNNLQESKNHVINPAKLIIKYVFGDNVLSEKEIWKNPTTGQYLHIKDKSIEIIPEYNGNQYELKDKNPIKVDLNDRENVLIVQCKKKDVSEKIRIKSIGKVEQLAVDLGIDKELVINKLAKKTFIVDSNDKQHQVDLTWKLGEYNENKAGEYTAIGTFKLPEGINQSEPETKLEIVVKVIVKEKLKNPQNSIWKVEDFTYEGTTVTGFSEEGKEKLKVNKDLVLPKVNKEGQSITKIGERSFYNMGLIGLKVPEGLNELVIEAGAFQENDLKTVFIPEGVREILTFAFYKNDLMYVDFPGTVKKIGNQAFAYNKLISMTIAEGPETICLDRFSFYNNQLTSVTILKDVKKIHGEAFKDNIGHENDKNKVHVFVAKLDHENNGLFEFSDYHKVILLGIKSVESVKSIETALGTEKNNIDLPEKIKLKLNNGDIKEVPVTWLKEDYNANKAGEYTFTGSYELPKGMIGEKGEIKARVIVKDKIDECFIATAAYGSKFQPAVVLLRHFRDDYLLTNNLGKAFVEFYYKNSPPIANFIADSYVLKNVVKILLTPFVVVVYGLYHPIFMFMSLLVIIILVLFKNKHKLYKLRS